MKKLSKILLLLFPMVLSSCDFFTIRDLSVSITDDKASDYKIGDVFDDYINNGGLLVTVLRSDNSRVLLEKDAFTYEITSKKDSTYVVDPTKEFKKSGNYIVTVTYGSLKPVSENIFVKDSGSDPDSDVTITEIEASSYTTTVMQGETYSFDGTITATMSDGSKKTLTKSEYTVSSLDTSTLGEKTVTITSKEDSTKTVQIKITVVKKQEEGAVLESISLDPSTVHVAKNSTFDFKNVTNVMAHYSDDSVLDVTKNAKGSSISTTTTGTKNCTISYTENGTTKTANLTVIVDTIKVSSISLNPTTKTIDVGSSFSITPTVLPENASNKALTWKSNSTSVATVNSNGEVTGKAAGSTIITATAKDGSGIKATCNVSVTAIEATGISLDKTTLNLSSGSNYTLAATITPSNATTKTVNWSSNDTDVATVSTSGKVTALAVGSAVITAKTSDGTNLTATCTVTVSPVLVTSVSMSSTLSVQVGKTSTLSATVLPSNATNKTLNWSTSKSSIATVDSTGKVTAVSEGTAVITAKSTDGSNKQAQCTVTVTAAPVFDDDWTLLIYMCGADLESDRSQGGAATEDLTEIYSLRNSLPSDVNVVVQAGGASRWESTYSSVINKDKCNRFHLTKTGYVKDSQTSTVNMGLESSLESFVEWGLTTYPAEKVGLVFWNHGGAMDGCCFDEQFSNNGLTPAEVAAAIPTAISRSNYNQKLEFIGYDCCLMSIQDIAGLNSEYAKYMIASEEAEWGYGWTYNEWVDDLFAKSSTETILKACVDSFYSETEKVYDYYGEDNDQTLAYYNLQNWDAYETAWEDFSEYLSSSVIKSSSNWTTFKNVVNSAKKYGRYTDKHLQSYNNGYICDIFDVKDFLDKFKASSSYKSDTTLMDKVSSVLTAFTGLDVYSRCGSAAGNSYGLCMFCPISGYNEKDVQYDENNTCFTYWRSLCRTYGNWYR